MQKSKSIAGKILFAVFVIVFVGIIVLPFFWQFMTSINSGEVDPEQGPLGLLQKCIYETSIWKISAEQFYRGTFHNGTQHSNRCFRSICTCETSL